MNDQSGKNANPKGQIEISDPTRLPHKPLVSVLMLAYNHGPYLADAIEGVLTQQTNCPIELLIGEDHSPDDTLEIALRYQSDHSDLIRVITSERNVGMLENFRRILDASLGEFVAICEGDDYWIDKNKLAKQVDVLDKHQFLDLSFHSSYTRFLDSNELVGPICIARQVDCVIPVEEVIAGDGGFMPSASLLMRRSAIDRIPVEIMKSAPVGDYILQVYGSVRGGAYYINAPMCVYRHGHTGSWSVSVNRVEDSLAFETSFGDLLDRMDQDLRSYRSSFTELIYKRYYAKLLDSTMRRNKELKTVYRRLLFSRIREYGLAKATFARCAGLWIFAVLIRTRSGIFRRTRRILDRYREETTQTVA